MCLKIFMLLFLCFYVMEYVGPTAVLHPPQKFGEVKLPEIPRGNQWRQRAKTALQIMDIVAVMKTGFSEELQHCDVKSPNFGLSTNGTIKTVDVDNLYFDNRLRKQLKSDRRSCKSHDECGIYTCKGWCDFLIGKCAAERMNNNFQVRLMTTIFLWGWRVIGRTIRGYCLHVSL